MLGILALFGIASTSADIRDFGAVGDGTAMCTAAIQSAIDKAATTGGTVLIPKGTFLTGSLHLKSHVEIHLDPGAVLLGSRHRKDYVRGRWFSLLLADRLTDIAITGEGTIDGQGKELAQDVLSLVETGEIKIPNHGWRPSEVDRPQILEITDCRKVLIEGVTIKHSCCWVQTYRNCLDLTIRGIKVDSKTYWNNDGIDVVDCKDVWIVGCDVDAADDGICLKSERKDSACENVKIEDCRVRSSASAIKFGTASVGGFKNIKVSRISVRDTYRSAIALESVDGGKLVDVLVEHIKAVNTGNAFFIRLGHRNLRVPPGKVRHIVLRDIDVQVPTGQPDKGYPFQGPPFLEPHNLVPSSIVGHESDPIVDVRLERIKIEFGGGGMKSVAFRPFNLVPERPSDYPDFTMFGELPAWAIYMRHVRGLKIQNLFITQVTPDYRPAFVADDVSLLSVSGLTTSGTDIHPTIATRGAKGLQLPRRMERIAFK